MRHVVNFSEFSLFFQIYYIFKNSTLSFLTKFFLTIFRFLIERKIKIISENYDVMVFISDNFNFFLSIWTTFLNFKDFMLDEMHRRKVEKDIADLKKLIGN